MSDEPSNQELVLALARRLREVVLPELGSHAGRIELGGGAGGDVTFSIDETAEAALAQFVADHAPWLAFYSEDRGLVAPAGDESHVLVVDPIDGTRPAMAGLESACVAVALAPLDGDPKMRDVEVACVLEIKSGDWFLARRDEGVLSTRQVNLSSTTDIGSMFWGYGFRGRPARENDRAAGDADRRLLGRRWDLRARLPGVRDDARGHGPAGCRDRGGLAHDR